MLAVSGRAHTLRTPPMSVPDDSQPPPPLTRAMFFALTEAYSTGDDQQERAWWVLYQHAEKWAFAHVRRSMGDSAVLVDDVVTSLLDELREKYCDGRLATIFATVARSGLPNDDTTLVRAVLAHVLSPTIIKSRCLDVRERQSRIGEAAHQLQLELDERAISLPDPIAVREPIEIHIVTSLLSLDLADPEVVHDLGGRATAETLVLQFAARQYRLNESWGAILHSLAPVGSDTAMAMMTLTGQVAEAHRSAAHDLKARREVLLQQFSEQAAKARVRESKKSRKIDDSLIKIDFQIQLMPLGAAALAGLLGIERAAAEKRRSRLRQWLAEFVQRIIEARDEEAAP